MALLHAALYGMLSAFRLLPPVTGRAWGRKERSSAAPTRKKEGNGAPSETHGALASEQKENAKREGVVPIAQTAKKRGTRRFILGYLVLDLSFFLLFAVFYLLFLFFVHGGVFRLYSLLFAALGAFAFRRVARALVARPSFLLLSLPFSLLSALFSCIFALLQRKKPKQLDETDKIV